MPSSNTAANRAKNLSPQTHRRRNACRSRRKDRLRSTENESFTSWIWWNTIPQQKGETQKAFVPELQEVCFPFCTLAARYRPKITGVRKTVGFEPRSDRWNHSFDETEDWFQSNRRAFPELCCKRKERLEKQETEWFHNELARTIVTGNIKSITEAEK